MKCPLFVMTMSRVERSVETAYAACLKEECAWWDNRFGQCVIGQIQNELATLGNLLGHLIDKMPHEVQFRK